jgi:hypothetical protein
MKSSPHFFAFGWPDINTMGKGEFEIIVIVLVLALVALNKLLKK